MSNALPLKTSARAFDGAASERPTLVLQAVEPTLGERVNQGLELWRDILAYVGLGMTPVVAYLGNLGFAPLVGLLGIGSLPFLGRRTPINPAAVLLALLLVWALISMSWSPAMPVHPNFRRYKDLQAMTGIKLVFELALNGAFVMAMQRVKAETAARASLVLGAALSLLMILLVVEALDGGALYQWVKAAAHQKTRPDLATRNVARGCYVAVVLFWPVVLRLRRAAMPALVAVLIIGLVASGLIFRVDSPILALLISALVFVAVQAAGRPMVLALMVCTIAYFASAPLVAHLGTHFWHPDALPASVGKQSWVERLDIWRFVAREIIQNPLKGWGLDASRSWPADIPLHPHDAAMQIWLELGAGGVCLAALFWAWLFIGVADLAATDQTMAAASAAAACAYLSIGALSFGVWQEWWLAVGAIVMVVCGFVAASRRLDPDYGKDVAALRPIS
jgi:O-antigen ligase